MNLNTDHLTHEETTDAKSPGVPDAKVSQPRLKCKREPLLRRLHRALGPLAGAMVLDLVDLATFGPIGVVLGPVVGAIVGWWVSGIYDFSPRGRLIFALLAAVYCTVPFTEPFPIATAIAAIARFRERPLDEPADAPEDAAPQS